MPEEVTDAVASYTQNTDFWVRIIRENLDQYRTGLTNDAVLTAAGDVNGQTVLDAGCAEGYMARLLAARGAKVVGVDSCAPLITAAQAAPADGVDFQVGDLARIPADDAAFDLVVLNHVVQDLPDPEPAFREVARVTRPGGRVLILMLHPCFYAAKAERQTGPQPAPADYFGVRTVRQPFVVAGITSPAPVTAWLRPLEAYAKLLFDNGYAITSLTEPHPSAEQIATDPWWSTKFVRPLFLLIGATKLAR